MLVSSYMYRTMLENLNKMSLLSLALYLFECCWPRLPIKGKSVKIVTVRQFKPTKIRFLGSIYLERMGNNRTSFTSTRDQRNYIHVVRNFFVVFLFDSLRTINNLSVIKGTSLPGLTQYKLGLMFLLKDTTQWRRWGSNTRSLGLESSTLRSHS